MHNASARVLLKGYKMTRKEIERIVSDDKWVKIKYESDVSRGEFIVKDSFFNKQLKKFKRLLKNCEFHVIYDYQLTYEEIVFMDEEYQYCCNKLKRLYNELERAKNKCNAMSIKDLKELITIYETHKEMRKLELKGKLYE